MKAAAGEKIAFTVKEAAAMLSLSRTVMYELIQAGRIGSVRIGRSRRITKKQLDLFVEEAARQTEADRF